MTPARLKWLPTAVFVASVLSACTSGNGTSTDPSHESRDDRRLSADELANNDVDQAVSRLPRAEVISVGAEGVPTFLRGDLGTAKSADENGLRPVVTQLAPVFRLDVSNLKLVRLFTDELGMTHAHYRQLKSGLAVVGGDLAVHVGPTGMAYAANGTARDGVQLSPNPSISKPAAVQKALASKALDGASSAGAGLTYLLAGDDEKMRLVYEVEVRGTESTGLPARDLVYVDANTGDVAMRAPQIHTALNRDLYTANNGSSTPGTLVRAEGAAPVSDAIVNTNYDLLGEVYNYYSGIHGRDSYNNAGAKLISTVHYSRNYVNAYWDGTQMVYGDGKLPQADNLAKSIDVTGHELTHAVTEFSSDLIYSGESGAINESMSDIFGNSIQSWHESNHDDAFYNANTFMVGEDIWTPATPGDALRYMDNPTQDGSSRDYYPERYTGGSDNGGVHWNSGISNLAWSLLVKGGTHPRGKTNVTVPAIGKIKASKVFYRANTVYLTSSAKFRDLRNAVHQSALDLYDQATADATTLSFDCVGVQTGGGGGGGDAGTPDAGTDAGTPDAGTDAGTPDAGPDAGTPDAGTDGGTPDGGEVVLQNDVPVNGLSGARQSQTFFRVDVPAGATNLAITISGSTSGLSDADLYTRFGSRPTKTQYDCRPYRTGSNETCVVASPNAGSYYVMLVGWSNYNGVALKATWSTSGGDVVLSNGVPVTGLSGALSSEKFFQVNVPSGASTLTVSINGSTANTNDADLYLRAGEHPSTTQWNCRPYRWGSVETCTMTAPTPGPWFVLLRGYTAYTDVTLTASY